MKSSDYVKFIICARRELVELWGVEPIYKLLSARSGDEGYIHCFIHPDDYDRDLSELRHEYREL